ncbi:hypothetical protein SAMN04487898_105124 [Pedobacter sp. ok626]|uniref:hypothetical protein n=1 Tax=Pedobacter sp. ok626 TaxID=1761882 RepID=UPI00089096E5|nr:hypothetical protein [Pedobacter sp. ok626]SDJ94725.1 hypothetical protein SAMN04487898_105124 [Pedobacter sp. ok626]
MLILNALKPDINKLGQELTKHAGSSYDVLIKPKDGIIAISDTNNIFTCTVTEKKQFPEVHLTFSTALPEGFLEKYVNNIIIPTYVDIDIQKISDQIKKVFNDYQSNSTEDERYIGSSFLFENQQYFLMSSLVEGSKVYEFKIEISKINKGFKLHSVPMSDFINTKKQKISEYIREIENYINIH